MDSIRSFGDQPRRTQDWVNPRLQRYLLVSAVIFGVVFVSGVIGINFYFESKVSLLMGTLTDPSTEVARTLDSMRQLEGQKLVAQLIFSALFLSFWMAQAFITGHRIAGPIHKTTEFLKTYSANKDGGTAPQSQPEPLKFREKDFFHELAAAVNKALNLK